MIGQIAISVSSGTVRYEFVIRRNLTIIRGNSATGKTTLIDLIREYYEAGSQSGIQLSCNKTCRVIEGRDWKILLNTTHDNVVFIDEGSAFVRSTEFAEAIQVSDNYYVIVTRAFLPNLPYSVDEVYGIRSSQKYAGIKQVYHEFFRIYEPFDYSRVFQPELVVVEDSNAGYEFYRALDQRPYLVISAEGKAKVLPILQSESNKNTLLIADGAAFGAEMERVVELAKRRTNLAIFLPESFEWLVLNSGLIQQGNIRVILDNPSDFIESKDFFSWERYFTHLLIELTKGTYLQYSKRKLNPSYKSAKVQQQILKQIQKIQL